MRKTKRITAAVLAAVLLALSLFSAYAEPQTQTEIYSENSAGETVGADTDPPARAWATFGLSRPGFTGQ